MNQEIIYNINENESERIQILKIWFTIMILFIHSYSQNINFVNENIIMQDPLWFDSIKYLISQIICRCAVPGYFFISSILLYRKKFTWMNNTRKKIKTLLIPYIILNTFWILIYFVAQNIPIFSKYFSQEENIIANWTLLDYLNAYLGFRNGYPMLYHLWFIKDLIFLNLLSIAIKLIIDKFPKISFVILILIIILNIKIPFFLTDSYSLVFFGLGYYFVKYVIILSNIDKINFIFIIIVYLISILLDFFSKDIFINYLPHFISIIFGFIFFYRFTTKIKFKKLHDMLIYIAKYSFSIYLFHEMILTILKKFLTSVLQKSILTSILLYFGIPMLILLLCLLGSIILDKSCHKIYLILVGGRDR